MVMMVMAAGRLCSTLSSAGGLRQILKIRKRPVLRCSGEVRRQMRQLIGRVRVSVGLCGLRGSGQVRGDGLRYLLFCVGLDCWSCCRVLANWANGESWPLSDCVVTGANALDVTPFVVRALDRIDCK
jgi:hypothetical protein